MAVEKQGLCLRSDFGNVWAQLLSVHSPHTLQSLSLINPGFIRSHPAAPGVPLHSLGIGCQKRAGFENEVIAVDPFRVFPALSKHKQGFCAAPTILTQPKFSDCC